MKEASSQPFYVKFSSSKPLLHFRGPLPLGMGLCNWNLKFWKKKKKKNASVFTMVRRWKPPQCPWMDEQMDKVWSVHTTEHSQPHKGTKP